LAFTAALGAALVVLLVSAAAATDPTH